jgi:hypothetical protein
MRSDHTIGELFREGARGERTSLGEVTLGDLLGRIPRHPGWVRVVAAATGRPLGRLRARAIRHLLAENAWRERITLDRVRAVVDRAPEPTAGSGEPGREREARLILVLPEEAGSITDEGARVE